MSLRRHLYASFAGQWTAAAVSMASTFVLARLLTPAELGVFSVAMALVMVLQTLQSTGANEYLLYTDNIDIETRRSALGMSMLSSLALAVVILSASPLVAYIYENDGVVYVLIVVAINTVLGIVTAPVGAMLAREQAFAVMSSISAANTAILAVSQIALVWFGLSYIGLALGMIISTVASIAMHLALRPQYRLFRPRFSGMGTLLGFGGKLFGASVMTQINNSAPQILIGGLSGVGAAAMYGRANTITQIYSQMIARAVDPVLSARLAADKRDGAGISNSLFLVSRALTVLSIPFFGFVALYAHVLVPLLFGSQWTAAITPMRILCCGFAVWPLTSPTTALMLASGRPGMLLRIRTTNTVLRIVLIIAAAPFGLPMIAAGVALSTYVNLFQSLLAARTAAGLSLSAYLATLRTSFLVSGVTLLAAFALPRIVAPPSGNLAMVIAFAGAATSWLGSLIMTRHTLWVELWRIWTTIRRGSAPAKTT